MPGVISDLEHAPITTARRVLVPISSFRSNWFAIGCISILLARQVSGIFQFQPLGKDAARVTGAITAEHGMGELMGNNRVNLFLFFFPLTQATSK